MKDWKSTAAGILSFLITTLTTLNGFLVAGNLVSGGVTITSIGRITWVAIGINIALALFRAWIGLITNNADATATAKAINNIADIGPGAVSSTPASIATTPKVVSLILFCLLTSTVFLGGCSSFERDTFNSLAASQAVIDQAQTDYTSGAIKETSCTYAVINDAKAAQTVAVNAMVVYETEKNAGSSLSAQTATITTDLAAIVPLVAEVKILYTNPSSCVLPKGN